MKKVLFGFGFLIFALSCKTLPQSPTVFAKAQTFQLAKPIMKIDSIFFKKSAKVSIEMNHPGSEIFFSAKDFQGIGFLAKYEEPVELIDRRIISAIAHHPDFLKSEPSLKEVIKVNSIVEKAEISITPAPNKSYLGEGAASLKDLKKGSLQFRDGKWLGFRGDTVRIDLEFEEMQTIFSVGISFLEDHNSWIFLPGEIEVLVDGKVVAEQLMPTPISGEVAGFKFQVIPFELKRADSISIRILNLSGLPDRHPGKGSDSWLFIDEVFLNTYIPFKPDR